MTHTQKHLFFSIRYKPEATHAALEISNLTIFSLLSDLCSCLLKTPDTTHLYTLFSFFLNYVLLLNLKISPTSTGLNLKSLLRIYVIMNWLSSHVLKSLLSDEGRLFPSVLTLWRQRKSWTLSSVHLLGVLNQKVLRVLSIQFKRDKSSWLQEISWWIGKKVDASSGMSFTIYTQTYLQ